MRVAVASKLPSESSQADTDLPAGTLTTVIELPTPAQPTEPTQLIIVRRGRESTFRLLERQFGNDPSVRIIWDRRYQERRRSASDTVGSERRRSDRRPAVPTIWSPTHYLVVNID
jgi:hypothetical protein